MDAGLIAMRMRLSGGKEVAAEAETATAAVKETGAAAETANKRAARSANGIRSSLTRQISAMRTIGRSLTKYVTLPIVGIGVASGVMAAHFKRSVLMLHTNAGIARKDLAGLEKSFLQISRETTASPLEVSESAYRLAGSGLRDKALKEATLASAQLAMVGKANTEATAKTLGQVWYSEIAGSQNFQHDAAELLATVGAGDLRLEQLVEALGTGVPKAAAQAGLNLHEVNAVMAVFGDTTNNVSGFAAQFATGLHYFTAPGEKATKALEAMGLAQMTLSKDLAKPNGLVRMLSDLRSHLEALPGGIKGVQAKKLLAEILPGGRGRVFGAVLLESIGKLVEKGKTITDTTKNWGSSLKETAENPMVKIERAWSNIQASLVEIGGVLLPVAVPFLEHAANFAAAIGADFGHLPPVTQHWVAGIAGIAAILGPILLLSAKLLESWKAISELSIFGKLGGKGLLGKAGLVAGGVIASQTAGQAVGGDLGSWLGNVGSGAAIGAGVGSVVPVVGTGLGALAGGAAGGVLTVFQKLNAAERAMGPLQGRVAASSTEVAAAMQRQQQAGVGLATASHRLAGAEHHQAQATKAVRTARQHLNAVLAEYGRGSRPAIHAEARLTQEIDRHRTALRRLHNAERLHGTALSAYRTSTDQVVLAERHRINTLTSLRERQSELFRAAKAADPTSQRTHELANNLLTTEGHLAEAVKRHAATLQEAATKAGPKYAQFLAHASQESLRFGGIMQANKVKVLGFARAMEHLSEVEAGRGRGAHPHPLSPAPVFPGHEPHHHRGGRKRGASASSAEAHTSSGLRRMSSRAGNASKGADQRPVKLYLDPHGRRLLAEVIANQREDEEARG